MPRPDPALVYITFPDPDSARQIGASLVQANLAAGVNIYGPGTSIYHWQGSIREHAEWHLFAQTVQTRIEAIKILIREKHPYEVPCLIVLPITDGNPAFLEWICENCRDKPCGQP